MQDIEPNELIGLLHGRLGLLIGPGFTCHPACLLDLGNQLSQQFAIPAGTTLLNTIDNAIQSTGDEPKVMARIHQYFNTLAPSSMLSQLNKANWRAILSASLDNHLENQANNAAEKNPLRRSIVTITDLSQLDPPRNIPSFKLLGSSVNDKCYLSTAAYKSRRAQWRLPVSRFIDLLKFGPVLCLGMSECTWVLEDILAEFLAMREARPASIVFLQDDPCLNNHSILSFQSQGHRFIRVRATLGPTLRAATLAEQQSYPTLLPFADAEDNALATIAARHSDIATVVNLHVTPQIDVHELRRLKDVLFSPTVPRWDPFAHDIDFPREVIIELSRPITTDPSNTPHRLVLALQGAAASGKTTLLKRLAFDLAKKEYLVLWLHPSSMQDLTRDLASLIERIARTKDAAERRLVVIMDDPLSFGSLGAEDVLLSLKRFDGVSYFIMGLRTADCQSGAFSPTALSCDPPIAISLPEQLTAGEWSSLPAYLVKLEIASTISEATTMVNAAKGRTATDVLSTLYFFLQEARATIASSVRNEYLRLGDVAGISSILLGNIRHTSDLLRQAHEYTAVADNFRVPLPVEVLVKALGVDYGEWTAATGSGELVWGLFYAEESDDGSTISYRPRNAVVTRVLLESINGGSFGHAGELHRLRALIKSCTGFRGPVYREFCIRVLVPHDRAELARLEPIEIIALYDEAALALPDPERAILHHRALCIKNRLGDPKLAECGLNEALRAPQYPYSSKTEPDENIHTSMAATLLDQVDKSLLSLSEGKERVLDHLRRARTAGLLRPKAVHVQANLTLRLVDRVDASSSADAITLTAKAVADIDQSLLLIQNPAARKAVNRDQVQMLEDVRQRLVNRFADLEALKAQATALWDTHKNQYGFVLVARRLYDEAFRDNKRRKVRKVIEYCRSTIEDVRTAGAVPIASLVEVLLQASYKEIQNSLFSTFESVIDWDGIAEAAQIVIAANAGGVLHYRYIRALALAHLGRWPEATIAFGELRRDSRHWEEFWEPRDFLLNDKGMMRLVQGQIKEGGRRRFLLVDELKNDFVISEKARWPSVGETCVAYIEFSFGGPTAVTEDEIGLRTK